MSDSRAIVVEQMSSPRPMERTTYALYGSGSSGDYWRREVDLGDTFDSERVQELVDALHAKKWTDARRFRVVSVTETVVWETAPTDPRTPTSTPPETEES